MQACRGFNRPAGPRSREIFSSTLFLFNDQAILLKYLSLLVDLVCSERDFAINKIQELYMSRSVNKTEGYNFSIVTKDKRTISSKVDL